MNYSCFDVTARTAGAACMLVWDLTRHCRICGGLIQDPELCTVWCDSGQSIYIQGNIQYISSAALELLVGQSTMGPWEGQTDVH